MEIKELERKMDDTLLRLFKWIILDIIIAYVTLKITTFNFFAIATLLLLCSVIATYDNLDRYRFLKMQRDDLI